MVHCPQAVDAGLVSCLAMCATLRPISSVGGGQEKLVTEIPSFIRVLSFISRAMFSALTLAG